MKRDLLLWQFVGFTTTVVLGTILHFLYDFTNQNIVVAPFSAVNESTWEHMKLLYFSAALFALLQSRCFKEYKSFWCAKAVGIVTGIILIPVIFYTYNGAFGKSPDWLNITFFLISAAAAFIAETYLLNNNVLKCTRPRISYAILIFIGALFIFFTFATPKLPIFRDAITGTYGI